MVTTINNNDATGITSSKLEHAAPQNANDPLATDILPSSNDDSHHALLVSNKPVTVATKTELVESDSLFLEQLCGGNGGFTGPQLNQVRKG